MASSETGTISSTQYSGLTENSGSYGGSSYNEIPVSFDEQDDLENDQENKKGWKAEMIKLIEDIRQNITELQEGIIFCLSKSLKYFKNLKTSWGLKSMTAIKSINF